MELNRKVKSLMDEFPEADKFQKAKVKWQGYTVYYPVYHDSPKIGKPIVILEKDGDCRLSEGNEGLVCMNYIHDQLKKNNPAAR